MFYVELYQIDTLEFDAWTTISSTTPSKKTALVEIFQAELEILSADIKDDEVAITCSQHNTDLNYWGGTLKIRCKNIKVFDQGRNELTIDQFGKLCDDYWNNFSNR